MILSPPAVMPDLIRHPLALRSIQRRQTQQHGSIFPERIILLDERDLPLPSPSFDLLLKRDRDGKIGLMFEPHQPLDPVSPRKTIEYAGAMLMDTLDQMPCDTNIQGSMPTACKDVDTGLVRHDDYMKRQWMPDQVRHDANLG